MPKDELLYSLNAADVHWCVNAKGIKDVSCNSEGSVPDADQASDARSGVDGDWVDMDFNGNCCTRRQKVYVDKRGKNHQGAIKLTSA